MRFKQPTTTHPTTGATIPVYEYLGLRRKAARVPLRGRRNQRNQLLRLVTGRIAWVQTVQAFAALAQFDREARQQSREARTRPFVLDILASKPDPKGGPDIVLSERRREHWPDNYRYMHTEKFSRRVNAGNRNTRKFSGVLLLGRRGGKLHRFAQSYGMSVRNLFTNKEK